jgi:glycosyltransferase involved in cell wall biosynthesis
LAKKYNTKLIFDVRDIWPLTLIELGGYSPYNPFIVFLQLIEDFAYSKSDHIISNLKGLKIHINKRIKSKYKFTWIPNGFSFIDTNFKDLANKKLLSAIKRQVFSITYTGTIGEANSLDTLLEAAALIKNKKNIHINIIGTGRLAKTLKTKTKNLNLSNIHFWGNVSKTKIQSILKVSDACVRCAKRSGIHKYGNAANKIYEYLISGRPVINAYSGNYDIVKEFGAGITIPSENSLLLSKAIIKLYLMSKVKRRKMGDEGRRAAKNYLEYTSITKKLNKVISS